MTTLAILWIVACLGIGVAHPELMKLLLFFAWAAMAVMAIGSTLYSVFLLVSK